MKENAEGFGIPWRAPVLVGPAASFILLKQVHRQQLKLAKTGIPSPLQLSGVWVGRELFMKSTWNPPRNCWS